MDINDIIPQSTNDVGAIIFWVILIILIIAIIVLYYYAKRMKKKVAKVQQDLTAHQDIVNKSKEKRMQELSEMKNKVDRLIEDEKK